MTTVNEYRTDFRESDAAPPVPKFLAGVVEMCRAQIVADPLRAFGHRARLANIVGNSRLPDQSRDFARAILAELAEGDSNAVH
jgi:hypothetical protein